MNSHFTIDGVQFGDTDTIQGMSDGIMHNLWDMKEFKFVMKMMVTGSNFTSVNICRRVIHC